MQQSKRILFISFLAALLSSCTHKPKPPESHSAASGTAVASVGDTVIEDSTLLDRISVIEKSFPRIYSTHAQKKRLLEEMMNVELLYQAALSQHLDQRYEFKSRLADLYVQQLAEKARDEIAEPEIRGFYEKNRNKYDQVSARHILLKTEGVSGSGKAALKAKLEGLRKELLQKPDAFPEYAKKYSEDSTNANGGELGYFTRSMMVAPFSAAAFKLEKIGDISPIVESQFGYHLIQLTGDNRGFESHKEVVKDELLRETQKQRLEEKLSSLKSGKKFEMYEENLIKLSPLPKSVETDPDKLLPQDLDQTKAIERKEMDEAMKTRKEENLKAAEEERKAKEKQGSDKKK